MACYNSDVGRRVLPVVSPAALQKVREMIA